MRLEISTYVECLCLAEVALCVGIGDRHTDDSNLLLYRKAESKQLLARAQHLWVSISMLTQILKRVLGVCSSTCSFKF